MKRNTVVVDNPDLEDDSRSVRPKTPYTIRRDLIDYSTRVAITLYVLAGWSQVDAYLTAFPRSKLSPQSAPVVASRWFNSWEIRDKCRLFAEYYTGTCFPVKESCLNY